MVDNIFQYNSCDLEEERVDTLLAAPGLSIERIVSKGHTSPAIGWYDQPVNEWVVVLKGEALIAYENGSEVRLRAGEHLNIPAHCQHRVSWTDPEIETLWLAVHYPIEC
ncbi:cupin [Gammaproteobacteria bacterium 53_120_T64]|nr:cupin [Gammaproteobacteria bacterium 53_120_T64]